MAILSKVIRLTMKGEKPIDLYIPIDKADGVYKKMLAGMYDGGVVEFETVEGYIAARGEAIQSICMSAGV